jgi:hypothetical protein
MWDLLNKRNEECKHLRYLLEDSAAAHARVESIEKVLEALPPAQRAHAAACESCRDALRDVVEAREILRRIAPRAEEPGPWFVTRVMAAIAAREKELSEVTKTWLAVPKFASRLALASGALLLVASTWLYERPSIAPMKQPNAAASQESLFEMPQPPANQDDILISRTERNQ